MIDRRREVVQARFDAAASEVPELIRTLPDPAFLAEFGIVFEKVAMMMRDLTDLQSRAQGVTVALQGFVALASAFDAGRDDRFAANLMVYLTGEAREPWMSKLKFFERDPKTLAGVLAMPGEFAALAEGADDSMREFALPVPTDVGRSRSEPGGKGYRVLPGAPFATARNQFEHYSQTSRLEEWCRKHGDFLEAEIEQMKQHFADHAKQITGFLCIPIREPSTAYVAEDERRAPLGVLNIHWDRCDRLDNPHSAKLFAKATYPLQVLLAQMLVDLMSERPPRPDARLSANPTHS